MAPGNTYNMTGLSRLRDCSLFALKGSSSPHAPTTLDPRSIYLGPRQQSRTDALRCTLASTSLCRWLYEVCCRSVWMYNMIHAVVLFTF